MSIRNDMLSTTKSTFVFEKFTYAPAPFKETINYSTTQPLDKRPKGFGTHNATRFDEFTNVMRSEQHKRAVVKEPLGRGIPGRVHEIIIGTNKVDQYPPQILSPIQRPGTTFVYDKQVHTYDIGRTSITEFDPKAKKDHHYVFATDREKVFGAFRPNSAFVGEKAWEQEYKTPALGRRSQFKKLT